MNEKQFRTMLAGITPEAVQEAHQIVSYFDEQIQKAEGPTLTDNARGVLISALLIEYGKQKAVRERTEPAQAL